MPGIQPWVLRLFFLSRLSGILFQVLWTRIFTYLLGGTTQSVSAVITAFMRGLGVGSYLFGRLVDGRARRPLILYGLLELGVTLSGLAAFYAFQHIESLYAVLYTRAPQATIKWLVFLIAFVFISIPATLIGGTLPAIARHAVTHAEGVKSALGRLYAINSLGSSAGAILMLGLVWGIGYEASYHHVRRHHVGLDDPRERGQPPALHGGALPRGAPAPESRGRGARVAAAQRRHHKALVILKTFQQVFPQSLLWLPLGLNTQEAFLIGFRDEAHIDWEAWHEKLERVARGDLEGFGWGDPAVFFASFRAGPERLAEIASRVPLVNRDMNPVLDFLPQAPPGRSPPPSNGSSRTTRASSSSTCARTLPARRRWRGCAPAFSGSTRRTSTSCEV